MGAFQEWFAVRTVAGNPSLVHLLCLDWGNLYSTAAGDLGKEASLNLQPSVNGAIDYVVARARHHNWAKPSDKVAEETEKVYISCGRVAWEMEWGLWKWTCPS